MIAQGAPRPEDVFTPRAAAVNPKTYISRPDLERALTMALRVPKHVVIHGESGTGKTWLYKKVLGDKSYHYEVANMGLCAGLGSIAEVLRANVCRELTSSVDMQRSVEGGIPALAKLNATQTEKTQHFSDPLLAALNAVRNRARDKPACLVFDNLEQVTKKPELVQELAGYLLLVDDERYAEPDVKIMLVGTSNEVREFISQVRSSSPVANRINEVPEVSRLTDEQARELMENGFFNLLGCETNPDTKEERARLLSLLAYHSDRIPLHVQDLCFYVSCGAEENLWTIDGAVVVNSTKEWIKSSLVADVSRVQHNLNSIRTTIGRRNQVLYCLGQMHKYDFNAADVESALKRCFPRSSAGVFLSIPKILSDLATSDHPIIKKNPNSNYYRFIDPKFRIVVRWILNRTDDEEIDLRDFDNALGLWSS